jgi:uncharacterized protein (DUF1501 family)
MLRLTGRALRACDGCTRRDLLQLGGLAALGLPLLPVVSSATAAAASGFGRARACVVLFLFGGPSQIDTFDLKPDAPAEFRGEFRPIATKVSGIQICEHLPRLAQQADKFCLIRSMSHPHPRHGWGLYYMLTGRRHNRPDLDAPPTPDDFPGLGALVSKLGHPRRGLPPAITLPRWNRFLDLPNAYAGEKAGFLGSGHDPWLVQPGSDGRSFSLAELELPVDVPPGRLAERRDLLAATDRHIARWGELGAEHDARRARAYGLLSSGSVRAAFDLTREADRTRTRYGQHPFGQALLLARRLVEAGTTLVQVNWHADGSDLKSPFWDTHKDNFRRLKTTLLPPVDVALSAFLDDLHWRGLLASTLVLVMGEFGRTPRIGQVIMNGATDKAGRDHWPHAYTVLAAGGGVCGGRVYGTSDGRAAYVREAPVSPPDLQATVLHALGIRPNTLLRDREGRPHNASEGVPVAGLFGDL